MYYFWWKEKNRWSLKTGMCTCTCVIWESVCPLSPAYADWQASIRPSWVICNLLKVWPKFSGGPDFLVQEGSHPALGEGCEPPWASWQSSGEYQPRSGIHSDSCGSASFTNHGECVWIMCVCLWGSSAASQQLLGLPIIKRSVCEHKFMSLLAFSFVNIIL